MRKRSTALWSGIAALSLLLTACGDVEREDREADASEYTTDIPLADDYDPEGHIRTGEQAMPPSWDPIDSITNGDFTAYIPVYDRLLDGGPDGNPVPMLAESFEPTDDNMAMVLELKQGLTFSDGTPFDADAAKFNIDRAAGPESSISGELNMVTSTEALDEYTLKINIDGGIGGLAAALTSRQGIMVSPTAAAAGTLPSMPVGIGPYVATEINPGVSVELERTPDYWDPDAQRAAKMTYQLFTDDQARFNALTSGEIDVARINADQLDDVTNAGSIGMVEESPLFLYLGLNASVAPFDDPEVRKALNMAIDREAISQGLYDGFCTPSVQFVPESSPGYSEKLGDGSDVFPYDPEAAKAILEEKGATDVTITAVPPNVTIYTKLAEIVQQQLAEVGITMQVKPVPPAQLVEEFAISKVSESTVSIATVINDPEAVHGRYLMTNSLFNPGGTDYPELNAIAAEASVPLDLEERKPLYEKYWDAWVETPPHIIPICNVQLAGAVNDNVSGVSMPPGGNINLRGAAVAKE